MAIPSTFAEDIDAVYHLPADSPRRLAATAHRLRRGARLLTFDIQTMEGVSIESRVIAHLAYAEIDPARDAVANQLDQIRESRTAYAETDWKALDPAEKVRIIEAMGFTPVGDGDHALDCPHMIDRGLRCNCVPDATSWTAPQDVLVHRGETWEQRLAAAKARTAREDS